MTGVAGVWCGLQRPSKEERERGGEKDLREVHRLLGALPVGTVINPTRSDQVIDDASMGKTDAASGLAAA